MGGIVSGFLVYIENLDSVQQVFIVSMGVAIILPLLNILIGGIASVLHIDFDFDTDGMPVSEFFPIAPMCILTFLLVFGGIGLLLYESMMPQLVILVSILCGYISAVILNKLVIIPMKKADSRAIATISLIGSNAKVITSIEPMRLGEVEVVTKHGRISYLAKSDTAIKVGSEVSILGIVKENENDIMEVRITEGKDE